MNIEFANRLAALRKEHNLSQEELASRLGVSRQAVSKWECGESSPDTDNLIALSKEYGISLDELVTGKKPEPSSVATPIQPVKTITYGGGRITIEKRADEDDEESEPDTPLRTATKVIGASGFILATIAYLFLGFFWYTPDGVAVGWASGWILYLVVTIILGLLAAIEKRKASAFPYAVLVAAIYLGMGIIGICYGVNLWHPYWIFILTIPIYHAVLSLLENAKAKKK